jgi:hypothetical protein
MNMGLDNLIGKTPEQVEPDNNTIHKLLDAAKRNLADARIKQLSSENQFDAAYKAIMQLANAALQANGYRTLTSKPGHHMTMIQSLNQTCGLANDIVIVLDKLRKLRNVADYSGDAIPESAVKECTGLAEQLFKHVNKWLREYKPELFA